MPLIQVKLIEEVFTPAQKKEIIKKLTDAMVSVEGVSNVGYPQLIDPGQLHPASEVEKHLQLMIRIRGYHERPRLDSQ